MLPVALPPYPPKGGGGELLSPVGEEYKSNNFSRGEKCGAIEIAVLYCTDCMRLLQVDKWTIN
jgi:hypothetical protein